MSERIFRLALGKMSFKQDLLDSDWKNIKFSFTKAGQDVRGVEFGNSNFPPPSEHGVNGPGYFVSKDQYEKTNEFYSSFFAMSVNRRWLFDINLYIGLTEQEEDHQPWLCKDVNIDIKVVRYWWNDSPHTVYKTSFTQGDLVNKNTQITGPWNCNSTFIVEAPKNVRGWYTFRVFVRLGGDTSQQIKEVYVLDLGSYLAAEALPLVAPDV